MIRFAMIMVTTCLPEVSHRKILVKFSTYPDPLEWILLLEDITTSDSLKVIPLFCTAQPFLRITLIATSKMAAVLPASEKRTDKGRFCRAKAFIRNMNAANRLKTSWSALKKKVNEKNVRDLEVCSGFPFRGRRVVEWNVLAEALDGGCEACGAALRLSNCIKETVTGLGSLLYICCSNSECGETNICRTNKTHRSTGTTRGRPIFDVNTKLAANFFYI